MKTCRVCGEEKSEEEFRPVIHFTRYKKTPVVWCKECQQMWIDIMKERERWRRREEARQRRLAMFQESDFEVSFL